MTLVWFDYFNPHPTWQLTPIPTLELRLCWQELVAGTSLHSAFFLCGHSSCRDILKTLKLSLRASQKLVFFKITELP